MTKDSIFLLQRTPRVIEIMFVPRIISLQRILISLVRKRSVHGKKKKITTTENT